MLQVKLTKKGVNELYKYISNHKLFEIIENSKNKNEFYIFMKDKNWFNRFFKLSSLGIVKKDIGEKDFYYYVDTNLVYELDIDTLIDFLATIKLCSVIE